MRIPMHTPAPWEYHRCKKTDENRAEFQIRRVGSEGINGIVAFTDDAPVWGAGRLEADARIIAAAPALAYSLRDLLSACDHGNGSGKWEEAKAKARAALKDAYGE